MKYSQLPSVQLLIEKHSTALEKQGVVLANKKDLPYGTQFTITGQGSEGLINIYYSKKKGISVVDCTQNSLTSGVCALLTGHAPLSGTQVDGDEGLFETWIGTDESGKGDFFGPLVVAGFVADRSIEKDLQHMGVRDCKQLNDTAVVSISRRLHAAYKDRIAIVGPSMDKYNQLYSQFNNLNALLAWSHGTVIKELTGKFTVDGCVVDKFGDMKYIQKVLSGEKAGTVIQRHRAEDNTAVAAASILARDRFLYSMQRLSENYGMKLPLGASAGVKKTACLFAEKFGKTELRKVAKIHFKTYNEI